MNTTSTTLRTLTATFAILFSVATVGLSVSTPEPIEITDPILTRPLARESGQVNVRATINQFGYVVDAVVVESTNPKLNRPALEAMRRWLFRPAENGGQSVATSIIQPFYFNDGNITVAPEAPIDRSPVATRKVAPRLPQNLENALGRVVLEASILENGEIDGISVRHSTHPQLESSAITALQSWVFRNAVKDGKAVSSKVVIPFDFKGTEDPDQILQKTESRTAIDRGPRVVRRFEPVMPVVAAEVDGVVRILAVVDEHGYVVHTEIVESDNEQLSAAATEALERWKFRPALKAGEPVTAKIIQPFRLNQGVFMAERDFDREPQLLSRRLPKLPTSVSGISGRVQVELHIDESGNVAHANVKSSTHPVLEDATLEAAKSWRFKPALKKGEAVSSTLIVPFVFGKG